MSDSAASVATTNAVALIVLDTVVAPALISLLFAALWCGVLLAYTYAYYMNFPRDSMGIKATVGGSVGLQILNIAIMTKMVYFYLVTSFFNRENLSIPGWEFVFSIVLLAIIDFIVQSFYAHRLRLLIGQGFFLRTIVMILPMPGLAFGLATAAFLVITGNFVDFAEYKWIVLAWFAALTGSDIILTSGQVFYLHYHRTGLARTNRLVNIIILYITSSAMVASILITIQLATFAVMGWNYTQVILTFQTSGIRVLFLLANVNSRQILISKEHKGNFETPFNLSDRSSKFTGPSSNYYNSDNGYGKHPTVTDTFVTKTTVVLSDNASIIDMSTVDQEAAKGTF